MHINFSNKKIIKKYIKILILFLIIIFLIGNFFIFSNSEFAKNVKNKFPTYFKENLKNTIFFIPSKIREFQNSLTKVQKNDLQIRELKRKIDVLNSKINFGKLKKLCLMTIS